MLRYLLDENLLPVVAEQLARKNSDIVALSILGWRSGALLGQADERVLRAATEDGFTLVTYDLKTIPLLLAEMAADKEDHSGVLFVDDATLRSNDFGGLVNALLVHWQQYEHEEWSNRVAFLTVA